MTIEENIYRGNRASEILQNEVFQQVFEDYRTEITEQWKKSPARDVEGREKLWLYLTHLNKLEAMIKQTLDSGKLASEELRHRETLMERARSRLGM